MFDEYVLIQKILAAVLVGYLLGSIPFARTAARLRGVDIFSTGSHMAGTANVFWNIGRWTGTLVFVGDVAKGSAAVVIAGLLEVPEPLILLVGAAAIFGHWMSVFARFRGGDGMAPLMGVTLAMEPALAFLGIAAGFAVILLLSRSSLRSSWGIICCFAVMLTLSLYYQVDRGLVLGLTSLASLVLLRSTLARHRRTRRDGVGVALPHRAIDPEPDLGPPAPESP